MISSGRDTDAPTPRQPFYPLRASCIVPAIAIIIRGVGRCAACATTDNGHWERAACRLHAEVGGGNEKKETEGGLTGEKRGERKEKFYMEELKKEEAKNYVSFRNCIEKIN